MNRRWIGPVLGPVASIAAFVCVAAALDRPQWPRSYPAAIDAAEEPAILGAVHDYQVAYEDFFATGGDPVLLDAIPATKAMKHQIFRDIGYLRKARLFMVQDLATVTLVSASMLEPRVAEVLVFEEWNWLLQRGPDRKIVSQVKGLGQGFRYRVEREAGRWVVSSWDVEDIPPPIDDHARKW